MLELDDRIGDVQADITDTQARGFRWKIPVDFSSYVTDDRRDYVKRGSEGFPLAYSPSE